MGGGGGGADVAGSDEDEDGCVGDEGGRDDGEGVDGGESDGDGGGGGDEGTGVMSRVSCVSCGSLSTSGRSKSGEVERQAVTRRLAMTAARLLARFATRAALDFFDALLVGGVSCLV